MPRPRKRRAEDAARKVPVSDPARRQRWRPGEPHPLDVMMEEATLLEQELQAAVKKVEAATATIQSLLGSSEDLAVKEEQTRQVFAERFGRIKHAEHLQATLAVLRRRRLLTRLQALEEILHLASWLETDIFHDEFMHDLYTALSEQQHQELTLTGDAVRSRRQLSYFESRLSRIRQLLTTANGYFETYSIRKRALPSAMMALLDAVQLHKEGQPLPEDLIVTTPADVQEALRSLQPGDPLPDEVQEVVQLAYWGPYLKYRWREDSAGPLYTIALGKISTAATTDVDAEEPEEL